MNIVISMLCLFMFSEAVSYESDGDFEDDHLLQMLRKQRAQYEQHLR